MTRKLRGTAAVAAAMLCLVATGLAASAAPERGTQTAPATTTTTAVDRRPLAVPPGTPTTTTTAATTTAAETTTTAGSSTTNTADTTTSTTAATTTTAAETTTTAAASTTTSTTLPVTTTVDVAKVTSSTGDVHLRTLDGLVFDFQEVGDYVAVQSDDYVLQARQSPYEKKANVSINTGVAMQVGPDRIEFSQEPADSLFVNGEQVNFPTKALELPGGGQVVPNGDRAKDVLVVLPTGEKAVRVVMQRETFIDYSAVRVGGGTYAGLLGNHDGERDNDLRTQGGQGIDPPGTIEQVKAWGDSWLVPEGESLFRAPNPAKPATEAVLTTVEDLPEADVTAAEATCEEGGITEELASQSCVYDVAVTGDEGFVASAQLVQESQESLPEEERVLTQGITTSDGGGLSIPLLAGVSIVVIALIALMFKFATKKPAAATAGAAPAATPAASAAPAASARTASDAPTTATPAMPAPTDRSPSSTAQPSTPASAAGAAAGSGAAAGIGAVGAADDTDEGDPTEVVTWDDLGLSEEPDAGDQLDGTDPAGEPDGSADAEPSPDADSDAEADAGSEPTAGSDAAEEPVDATGPDADQPEPIDDPTAEVDGDPEPDSDL